MAEILLGVTGGVAAYKAVDLLRNLQRRGHEVTVIMTAGARRFVGVATFAALSGRPVGTQLFGAESQPGYDHLDLARRADLLVVAPASANTIARMAAGLGDGLLAAVYLAFDGPVLVAPAMNTRMYLHPATRDNLEVLGRRGVELVAPERGLLADGDVGEGRLAATDSIAEAVDRRLEGGARLAGRRVLITAGGTREPLDAVRYLGNRSSGRMGWAVAEAAVRRGADVTVVASNVDLPRHPAITYVEAPTAADLARAAGEAFDACDLLMMSAAVADYRPAAAVDGKIDRSQAGELGLALERTDDVLAGLSERRRPGQVLVGFAAEHGPGGVERARGKLERKGLDLVVFNDIADAEVGFGTADNEVTILDAGGARSLPRMSKPACAEHILDAAADLLT